MLVTFMTNKRNLLTGQTSLSGLGRWENGSRHAWYKTNLERSGPDFPFVVGKILMYDKNLLRCCQTGSRNFATLEFYFFTNLFIKIERIERDGSYCSNDNHLGPEWVSLEHTLNFFLCAASYKYEPIWNKSNNQWKECSATWLLKSEHQRWGC